MIGAAFDWHAPRQLGDALELLNELGDRAKVLAGGMTLLPMMNLGLIQPSAIVSLNHLPELDYVIEAPGELRIGSQTRHATIQSHPLVQAHAPHLATAAAQIGDVQVRNRGTIGGSLAHADPAANYLPVLLVSHAEIVLQSVAGQRVVAAGDFVLGILTADVRPGELLVEIRLRHLSSDATSSYLQLTRVEGSFPLVTAAAVVDRGDGLARVAIGGVAATPVLIDEIEIVDSGSAVFERLGRQAELAVQEPLVDLHGDARYRRALAGVFATRALESASNRGAAGVNA